MALIRVRFQSTTAEYILISHSPQQPMGIDAELMTISSELYRDPICPAAGEGQMKSEQHLTKKRLSR